MRPEEVDCGRCSLFRLPVRNLRRPEHLDLWTRWLDDDAEGGALVFGFGGAPALGAPFVAHFRNEPGSWYRSGNVLLSAEDGLRHPELPRFESDAPAPAPGPASNLVHLEDWRQRFRYSKTLI